MTRLSAKYVAAVDSCTRCPGRPSVHPDGTAGTDATTIVLTYRCTLGHCWQRTWARSDLKRGPAKATTAPRRHLATTPTPTATTINDCTDESITDRNRASRQPGPRTGWHPERRAWLPR